MERKHENLPTSVCSGSMLAFRRVLALLTLFAECQNERKIIGSRFDAILIVNMILDFTS